MTKPLISLFSIGMLSASLIAQEAVVEETAALHAKHVSTTVSNGLPEGIKFMDKPFNYKEGASLTFFVQAENLVNFDAKSFQATPKGWKLDFNPRVSESGKTASFVILNKGFKGKPADIKIDGTVQITSGSKTESKTVTLKKDADPIELPGFTVQISLAKKEKEKGFFGGGSGVKVVGDYKKIKSITLKRTDTKKNGSTSMGKTITYYLKDIKDGDEVTFEYWTDLSKKTVKFSK